MAGKIPADRTRARIKRRRYVMGREDGELSEARTHRPLLRLGLHRDAEGVVRALLHLSNSCGR